MHKRPGKLIGVAAHPHFFQHLFARHSMTTKNFEKERERPLKNFKKGASATLQGTKLSIFRASSWRDGVRNMQWRPVLFRKFCFSRAAPPSRKRNKLRRCWTSLLSPAGVELASGIRDRAPPRYSADSCMMCVPGIRRRRVGPRESTGSSDSLLVLALL